MSDLHDKVMRMLAERAANGGKKKAPAKKRAPAKRKAPAKKAAPKKKAAPRKRGGIEAGIMAGKRKNKSTNPWINYVKAYAKLNNMSYSEALLEAGPSYHAQAR